jgi:hypothetical protein
MLHITNGDETVARMRDGGLRGGYLPWRDVLHEGPVPQTATLEQLSRVRAHYLADAGYGTELKIHDQFRARDAHLARAASEDEVVLWFEHDLYDQLQLVQILDELARLAPANSISLIVIGAYPGIARFVGLGQLSPAQVVGLLDSRVPVTAKHFEPGQRAWSAFREASPRSLAKLVSGEVAALPYLPAALLRLLEELPSSRNGLSRTERAILRVVLDGAAAPHEIFAAAQQLEESPFLGDWSFWRMLSQLSRPPEPLLAVESGGRFFYPPRISDGPEFQSQRLVMTECGREVLENRKDAVRLRPLDRWLGGTHLTGESAWRWDEERQRLVTPPGLA